MLELQIELQFELQFECTKQNQRNPVFDLDLVLWTYTEQTELFSQLTVLNNRFPKILERTCILLASLQVNCFTPLLLNPSIKRYGNKSHEPNPCFVTSSITLGRFSEAGHSVIRHTARQRLKTLHEIDGKVILFHVSKI